LCRDGPQPSVDQIGLMQHIVEYITTAEVVGMTITTITAWICSKLLCE